MTIPDLPTADTLPDLTGTSPWRAATASPGVEPAHVVDRNDERRFARAVAAAVEAVVGALDALNTFTVSLGPDRSIAVGGSNTMTVTTAIGRGAAQPLALKVEGLPAGVTGTFSADTIDAGQTATLTIAVAGGDALPGTSTVTVTAKGLFGSQSDTADLTITAVGTNDYAVSLVPAARSLASGASVATTVQVAVTAGSAQSTALAVAGLPTGVTGSFSSSPVTPSGSPAVATSTLTLTAAAGARLPLDPGAGKILSGMYYSGNSFAGIRSFESTWATQVAVFKKYRDFSSDAWPQSDELAASVEGRIVHYAFEALLYAGKTKDSTLPAPGSTSDYSGQRNVWKYTQITGGSCDTFLRKVARGIKSLPGPVFVSFNHEMDLTAVTPTGEIADRVAAGTGAQFAAAWDHIWDIFDSEGVENVDWALVFAGTGSLSDPQVLAFRPTASKVDWTGSDPYNGATWRTPNANFGRFYDRVYSDLVLGSTLAAKPHMFGEWGVSADSRRPAYFGQVLAELKTGNFPMLRCMQYFNSRDTGSLTDDASRAAWAAMNNDPIFVRSYIRPSPFTVTGTAGSGTRVASGTVTLVPGGVLPTVTLGVPQSAGQLDAELPNYASSGNPRTDEISGFALCIPDPSSVWVCYDDGDNRVIRVRPKAPGSTAVCKPSNTPPDAFVHTITGGSWTSLEDLSEGPDVLAANARRIWGYDVGNNARTARTLRLVSWPDVTDANIAGTFRSFEYRQSDGGGSPRYPDCEAAFCDRDGKHVLITKNDNASYYGEGTGARDSSKHRIYLLDLAAYSSPYRAVDTGLDLTASWNDSGTTRALLPVAACLDPELPVCYVLFYDSRGGSLQVRHEIRAYVRGTGMTWPQALAQTSAPGCQIFVMPNGGAVGGYKFQDREGMVRFGRYLLTGMDRNGTDSPAPMDLITVDAA